MSDSIDIERFVADCLEANAQGDAQQAMRGVIERAVSEPSRVLKGIGEPERAGVQKLYHSEELTVLNIVWGPHMTLMPHNHEMWAVIGIYTGREDNIFWRRLPDNDERKIKAAGAKELCVGDVTPLGRDIIHSVTNPIPRLTGAIHVYGGDFFGAERSEWDPESLLERRYNVEKNMRLFEESNSRFATDSER